MQPGEALYGFRLESGLSRPGTPSLSRVRRNLFTGEECLNPAEGNTHLSHLFAESFY